VSRAETADVLVALIPDFGSIDSANGDSPIKIVQKKGISSGRCLLVCLGTGGGRVLIRVGNSALAE
jgi:hypothetical protein